MTGATIIDGKAIAEALRREVAAGVAALQRERGLTPGLAVVLVGEDPASQVYVRTKAKATREAGMLSVEHKLPADTPEAGLLALIGELGRRPTCTASWCSCRCRPTSTPARSSRRSTRPRMSTASTPSTSGGWPAAPRRWRRARRPAA